MLQPGLGLIPGDAEVLSDQLAVARQDGCLCFFNASGPIYECAEEDRYGVSIACAVLLKLSLVKPERLAEAVGVDRSTVYRYAKRYREGGASALEPQVPRRGPHKLKGDALETAQRLLEAGSTQRAAAEAVGVSQAAIAAALADGRLARRGEDKPADRGGVPPGPKGASARAEENQGEAAGVAVKRHADRALAARGSLHEAQPVFVAAEAVRYIGVLLALPALLEQGLLEVGGRVYGSLRSGFFGLRSTLLILAFMALLRIKSPEQLTAHPPGELGLLLGLDRAPEVKTLRRKLRELGLRGLARELWCQLTERWASDAPERLGVLYVDGHVRPYHGRNGKHTLLKGRVPRMRLSMPATKEFWVNDKEASPLFVVSAPGTEGLITMLDQEVLPEVRRLAGDRRVQLVFDREGWSPKNFERWYHSGFDVLTYRKGKFEEWREEEFEWVTATRDDGKRVRYHLAEREVELRPGFFVREIRRRCNDGHQTAIIATNREPAAVTLACQMFARWRQENFFRYMRQEFALDHLCTYAVEALDPDLTVPNPARKERQAALRSLRAELAKLEREYGQQAHSNPESQRPSMRGFKIANGKVGKRIRALRDECDALQDEMRALPKRVPVAEATKGCEIVKLEEDRKRLSDALKTIGYRSETSLASLVSPAYARHEDEVRGFLKAVFQLPGDLVPDSEERVLRVRLHGMANPRSTHALQALCDTVNSRECLYPGTDLRLHFEVLAPCSEMVAVASVDEASG